MAWLVVFVYTLLFHSLVTRARRAVGLPDTIAVSYGAEHSTILQSILRLYSSVERRHPFACLPV